METIWIIQDHVDGNVKCHWRCIFNELHENTETDETWRTCKIDCMTKEGTPGVHCPGPGCYELTKKKVSHA
jgi:hypothetical protein